KHVEPRLRGTELMRDDDRADEEWQALEAVGLGAVGACAPAALPAGPVARMHVVARAEAAGLCGPCREVRQAARDEDAPVGDGERRESHAMPVLLAAVHERMRDGAEV